MKHERRTYEKFGGHVTHHQQPIGKNIYVKVPWAAMSKPRPRSGAGKKVYMPRNYMEWKENIADWFAASGIPSETFEGNVVVDIRLGKDHFEVFVEEVPATRFGRQDIDNAAGGVLDALQDAGVISDDRNVVQLDVQFKQYKK